MMTLTKRHAGVARTRSSRSRPEIDGSIRSRKTTSNGCLGSSISFSASSPSAAVRIRWSPSALRMLSSISREVASSSTIRMFTAGRAGPSFRKYGVPCQPLAIAPVGSFDGCPDALDILVLLDGLEELPDLAPSRVVEFWKGLGEMAQLARHDRPAVLRQP